MKQCVGLVERLLQEEFMKRGEDPGVAAVYAQLGSSAILAKPWVVEGIKQFEAKEDIGGCLRKAAVIFIDGDDAE